jgi:hypothetical protein
MKLNIDKIIEGDKDLQAFLSWINQKTRSIESFYKPAAIRAFYLAVDLARATSLERATNNIILCAKSIATNLIFEDSIETAFKDIQELVVELDFDFSSIISPDRTLAFAIDNDLTIKNGELVLQEDSEIQGSVHLTQLEETLEELDRLEEMSSTLLDIEDRYVNITSQIEELETECKESRTEIEEIKTEKMGSEQEELDDLEQISKRNQRRT